jgi:hypothetical protein
LKKPVPVKTGAGFFHSGWRHFMVSQAFIMSAFFILSISMPALCMQSFLLAMDMPSFFIVSVFMVSLCIFIVSVFMLSAWAIPAKERADSTEAVAMAVKMRVMKSLLWTSLNVRRHLAGAREYPFGRKRRAITPSRVCDGIFGRDFFEATM